MLGALRYPRAVLTAAMSCLTSAQPCAPPALCAGVALGWGRGSDPQTRERTRAPPHGWTVSEDTVLAGCCHPSLSPGHPRTPPAQRGLVSFYPLFLSQAGGRGGCLKKQTQQNQ